MTESVQTFLRDELIERQRRLQSALARGDGPAQLVLLLRDVDAALERIEGATFGSCETCHDPIEPERLIADPLVRFCLDHLTQPEQRALERDLELAALIQRGLLPEPGIRAAGWETDYRYEPAGPVSGDYCDLIPDGQGNLFFLLGDVSGKGVAASMLMSQLHAMFRTLTSVGLPLGEMVERASRVFCESSLPSHYATLVCGRAGTGGEVEICNAGHLPPLVLRNGSLARFEATGLPLGIFCDESFSVETARLAPGDAILLYSDGFTEAQDASGTEYGCERLEASIRRRAGLAPRALIAACLEDLQAFAEGTPRSDDRTIMALRRASETAA